MDSCVCVCVKDRLHKRKRETTRPRKDETVRLSLIRNYKLSFTTGTPARGPTRGPTHAPTEAECYRRGVSLPEVHGLSTKQRQRAPDGSRPLRAKPRDLEAAAEQGASAGSTRTSHAAGATNPPGSAAFDSLFPVRQHFVLAKSRSLQQLPPAPYIGRRAGRHVDFIPCPFRTGIRSVLLGTHPRFTSADCH